MGNIFLAFYKINFAILKLLTSYNSEIIFLKNNFVYVHPQY